MKNSLAGTRLPAARVAPASRVQPARRSLKVSALFNLKTKAEEEEMGGFVFDPSMQRWIRSNKKADPALMTVTPKSGMPYTVWPVMWNYLNNKKLKSVDAKEAQALMKKGAMLIDVRLGMDFDSQHAAGAVSVPLFRLTAGNSGWDQFKKVVMAGLNMRPTERDPDFVKNVERAVNGNKRKKVILMCTIGGTLDTVVRVASTGKKTETDKDRAFGRESRSLKACYELMWAGFTDVVHLKGGLSEWTYDGNPVEPK